MKKLFTIVFFLICYAVQGQASCPIIPLPSSYTQGVGELQLNSLQYITIKGNDLSKTADFLQKEMQEKVGLALQSGTSESNAITLELTADEGGVTQGAYTLNISSDRIKITAASREGVFYGVNSLLQLARLSTNGKVDCWQIEDKPGFEWRGLMLDEARHFYGKETIKHLLDWMSFYKLNRFHWHLTDRQGWRIEIKSYPDLALVGGLGNHTNSSAPAAYYTHEDINEIVQYASERFIEIVPEIDMPGHATAANRAYPEFSGDGADNPPAFTFNPGKEGTYVYLTKILQEVKSLFPSNMIHMGGDEVQNNNQGWNTNPDIQALMKREGFTTLKQVESYFNRRMADNIFNMGAKVLGWDEVVAADIPNKDKTILFWWRASQEATFKEALDKGYSTVICPNMPLYLDYNQDINHIAGRQSGKVANTSESIYNVSLDDYPNIITEQNSHLILGIQANIWTERIKSLDRLEYVLFPRMAALAETAWTNTKTSEKNYSEYESRLSNHFPLYEQANVKYYNTLNPSSTPEIIDLRDTYYWTGTDATASTSHSGWNTKPDGTGVSRAEFPTSWDILIVDGKTLTISEDVNITLRQLEIRNNANVTLQGNASGAVRFSLEGDAETPGLLVDNSTLTIVSALAGATNVTVNNGAEIDNSNVYVGDDASKACRLERKGNGSGSITFKNKSKAYINSQAAPFGTGGTAQENSVIFDAGTELYFVGGGMLFSNAQGSSSALEFKTGSSLIMKAASSNANMMKGRILANVVIDNNTHYQMSGNGSFTKMDNLVINDGCELGYTAGVTASDSEVTGSILINTGGILNLGGNVWSGSATFETKGGATLITSHAGGFVAGIKSLGAKNFSPMTNYQFNTATLTPFPLEVTATNNIMLQSSVELNQDIDVSGSITFNPTTKLTIPNGKRLNVNSSSPFVGAGADAYIVAQPAGVLSIENISTSTLIPIGTESHYLSTTIAPENVSNFTINVFEGVTKDATAVGEPFIDKNKIVDATWNINRTSGTGNYDVTLEWTLALEGAAFSALTDSKIGLFQYLNAAYVNQPLKSVDNSSNVATISLNENGALFLGDIDYSGILDEIALTKRFKILSDKNPYQLTFILATEQDATAQVELYDIDGRKMQSSQVEVGAGENNYMIRVPNLTNGVYFLKCQLSNNEIYQGKFIR